MKRMIEKISSFMKSVSASGVVAFALVLFVSSSVGAVSAFAGEPVNEALGFTRVIQDPVTGAMGGAGVVLGNAWSSYRNAAAVPFSDSRLDFAYLITTGSSSPLKNTFALALGYSF